MRDCASAGRNPTNRPAYSACMVAAWPGAGKPSARNLFYALFPARFPEPGRFWALRGGRREPVAKATPAKMAAASSSDSDSGRAER